MRRFCWLGTTLAAWAAVVPDAWSQLNVPTVVQLPSQDFVSTWGQVNNADERARPDFTIRGVEAQFVCTATGAFKPGSRLRDYYNFQAFQQRLSGTIYFIQEVTNTFYALELSNDLLWATLNCVIPVIDEANRKEQERLDRALERAERQRDRRREREADRDDE